MRHKTYLKSVCDTRISSLFHCPRLFSLLSYLHRRPLRSLHLCHDHVAQSPVLVLMPGSVNPPPPLDGPKLLL